jgi:hypothetical protein
MSHHPLQSAAYYSPSLHSPSEVSELSQYYYPGTTSATNYSSYLYDHHQSAYHHQSEMMDSYTVPVHYPPLVPFPAQSFTSPAAPKEALTTSSSSPIPRQPSFASERPPKLPSPAVPQCISNPRGYPPDSDSPSPPQPEGSEASEGGGDSRSSKSSDLTPNSASDSHSNTSPLALVPNKPKYRVILTGVAPHHDVLSFPFIASLGHVLESSISTSSPSSLSSSQSSSSHSDSSSRGHSISYLLTPKTPAQYQQLSVMNDSTILVDDWVITVSPPLLTSSTPLTPHRLYNHRFKCSNS